MIRGVIIDDEYSARDALRVLLSHYCSIVDVVAEAHDVKSGVQCIKLNKPDIVFLDVKMPDGDGFDLLHQLNDYNFNIIFTTAHSDFAIEAFKHSAIHYLLKPIIPDELIDAVHKAETELENKDMKSKVLELLLRVPAGENRQRLVLTTNNKLDIVNISGIIMCKSYKNYTIFYMEDGKEHMVSKTLKEYDEILTSNGFVRPHRQYMVNINHIKSVEKYDASVIKLTRNLMAPVSSRRKEKLLEILQKI